LDQEREADT
jgi:phosphoribosylaminoimidazolecarboxamide formyltransferase/IMP cyclohydrolase